MSDFETPSDFENELSGLAPSGATARVSRSGDGTDSEERPQPIWHRQWLAAAAAPALP